MNEKHARAFDVAADQAGILLRSQARVAGLSDRSIDRCLANGLLVPVAGGVYRVRGAQQTAQMAITAATLAAAGRASQATAAGLLRLGAPFPVSPIHVAVDAASQRPRLLRVDIEDSDHAFFAVKVHRSLALGDPTASIDGVPCADAALVLIECAPMLSAENLESMFERARTLGLVSTDGLARRFGTLGGRGRPGTPKIRELLANARPNPLESKLEVKAWRMLRASSLPEPARQVPVGVASGRWHRLDFAWPELLVAFETEGFEWHGSRARWKQDRIRTAALERLGWRIVVATWDEVVIRPVETIDRIALVLDERRSVVSVA